MSQFIRHSVYQTQSLESVCHFHCIIIRDLIQVTPEQSSGFPHFLPFKSEFGNKGVHVLSHSQLRVLFLLTRDFSILGCKEYNQPDFGVDHLMMFMCRVFSCVVGRGWLLSPVGSLGKTLLAFALLYSVFQAKFACYSRYLLSSYFCISIFYNEKDIFFWVLVLEGLVGLHRTVQLQLLQHYWSGIDLDYCDIEWFSLETKQRSFCHF